MSSTRKRSRRKRQILRIKKNIILIMLCFIAVTAFLSRSFITSNAKDSHIINSDAKKYYTEIRIEPGDSLWSISQQYMDSNYYNSTSDYLEEIQSINQLKNEKIKAGEYIVVPYYVTDSDSN